MLDEDQRGGGWLPGTEVVPVSRPSGLQGLQGEDRLEPVPFSHWQVPLAHRREATAEGPEVQLLRGEAPEAGSWREPGEEPGAGAELDLDGKVLEPEADSR